MEQELLAARRDVRLQMPEGFPTVKAVVSRIASLEQSLVPARTASKATTLGRDVGTRMELDVLNAQWRVFAAELDLAQARLDSLPDRIRPAAATGGFSESDLRALNARLASS